MQLFGRGGAAMSAVSGGPTRTRNELVAPLFVIVVLVLALAVTLWAPWRSDVGSGGARQTGAVAPTVAPLSTFGPPVVVGPAAGPVVAVEESRPSGYPLRRPDTLILRSYQEHGGPGPNGAVDIGLVNAKDALGTPVYATQDGTVRILRNNARYGNLVAIKNGRWSTTYGYLDQIMVAEGQTVRRGDQVGTLGRTGQATSPRLDYQVWEKVNGEEVNRNPADFLGAR